MGVTRQIAKRELADGTYSEHARWTASWYETNGGKLTQRKRSYAVAKFGERIAKKLAKLAYANGIKHKNAQGYNDDDTETC